MILQFGDMLGVITLAGQRHRAIIMTPDCSPKLMATTQSTFAELSEVRNAKKNLSHCQSDHVEYSNKDNYLWISPILAGATSTC